MRRSKLWVGLAVMMCALAMMGGVANASGGSGGGGSGSGGTTSGGGATGGGGGGGGGGGKTGCINSVSVTATASESLTGNAFSATYALVSCQSKTRVALSATDLQTGQVVFATAPDVNTTTIFWTLPYRLTTYRVDARALAGSASTLVASGSTTVSVLDPLPCTTALVESATVGYWLSYPAIWASHSAQDCGAGSTVRLVITNLNTGAVVVDYSGLGLTATIDYEGAAVAYDTPYHVEAELHSWSGELLARSGTDVRSVPML